MGDLDQLIEQAKVAIGNIIQKPKMTEKLLGKPPFRFLHDTISAVIQSTGFAEGLYTAEEQDSANINDKDAKVAYLQKIFNCVGICQGSPLEVKAIKVVAGQEPELTCKFLIALAEAASNSSVDSQAGVRRTLGGEAPGTGPPAIKSSVRCSYSVIIEYLLLVFDFFNGVEWS